MQEGYRGHKNGRFGSEPASASYDVSQKPATVPVLLSINQQNVESIRRLAGERGQTIQQFLIDAIMSVVQTPTELDVNAGPKMRLFSPPQQGQEGGHIKKPSARAGKVISINTHRKRKDTST